MLKQEIIKSFSQLGIALRYLSNPDFYESVPFPLDKDTIEKFHFIVKNQRSRNGWFTEENVWLAINSHADNLTMEELEKWQEIYGILKFPKSILVIMAGNIPLVGFHDFVSVLMSGNKILCKLSSEDATILPYIAEILIKINPNFQKRIEFVNGPARKFDAVIATGSNNTINQFTSYFKNYPCLFRKNRTSLAILNGSETDEELQRLGNDIFNYFGLGCRNVSHLIVPNGYDLNRFFKNIVSYSNVIHHHKYANNYDYNRAVFLLNKVGFLDNNFILLTNNFEINSPIAVLNYHNYETNKDIDDYVNTHSENIQVIVGENYLEFGKAQYPRWQDYADNLNTMHFLLNL
jgi:hypothetical protein